MVYVFFADGFEEVEALTCVDVLRRADVDTATVSIGDDRKVVGAHKIAVDADLCFGDCEFENCELMVLPGGMPGSLNLRDHSGLREQLIAHDARGGMIGAICAAPMVIGAAGLLDSRRATIYPGMEAEIPNAEYTEEAVTVDGNIVTGEGPERAMRFALTLVRELRGRKVSDSVAAGLLYK